MMLQSKPSTRSASKFIADPIISRMIRQWSYTVASELSFMKRSFLSEDDTFIAVERNTFTTVQDTPRQADTRASIMTMTCQIIPKCCSLTHAHIFSMCSSASSSTEPLCSDHLDLLNWHLKGRRATHMKSSAATCRPHSHQRTRGLGWLLVQISLESFYEEWKNSPGYLHFSPVHVYFIC